MNIQLFGSLGLSGYRCESQKRSYYRLKAFYKQLLLVKDPVEKNSSGNFSGK